jgi:crotonobetainyl-CoA:carnitine CoA-transferase CaiB-like acyl-CoA transferase
MTHAGMPRHFSGTPVAVRRPAPLPGEDTEYLIKKLPGRTDAEYQQLPAEGVIK